MLTFGAGNVVKVHTYFIVVSVVLRQETRCCTDLASRLLKGWTSNKRYCVFAK